MASGIYLSRRSFVGEPRYKGARSDHFDGRLFHNSTCRAGKTLREVLRWQRSRSPKRWPRWVENSAPVLPETITPNQIAITFINHATFLVQFAGLNILTDPVYSQRVSPFRSIGPKRVRAPGIPFENLPPIHLVLVSHNHYDHLDLPTLRRLAAAHAPRIVTGLGNRAFLARHGLTDVEDLDWWQETSCSDAIVTLTPAQHWSGRTLQGKNRSLWGGFIVKVGALQFFFAGDTGLGPHFGEIQRRFGSFDVSLLPIGAYEPRWFTREQHMNPDEAVCAHIELKSRCSIGAHFGCFQLTDEGFDQPIHDLAKARHLYGVPEEQFLALNVGETHLYSREQEV